MLEPGLIELLGQAHNAVEMLENFALEKTASSQQLTWKSKSISR